MQNFHILINHKEQERDKRAQRTVARHVTFNTKTTHLQSTVFCLFTAILRVTNIRLFATGVYWTRVKLVVRNANVS